MGSAAYAGASPAKYLAPLPRAQLGFALASARDRVIAPPGMDAGSSDGTMGSRVTDVVWSHDLNGVELWAYAHAHDVDDESSAPLRRRAGTAAPCRSLVMAPTATDDDYCCAVCACRRDGVSAAAPWPYFARRAPAPASRLSRRPSQELRKAVSQSGLDPWWRRPRQPATGNEVARGRLDAVQRRRSSAPPPARSSARPGVVGRVG